MVWMKLKVIRKTLCKNHWWRFLPQQQMYFIYFYRYYRSKRFIKLIFTSVEKQCRKLSFATRSPSLPLLPPPRVSRSLYSPASEILCRETQLIETKFQNPNVASHSSLLKLDSRRHLQHFPYNCRAPDFWNKYHWQLFQHFVIGEKLLNFCGRCCSHSSNKMYPYGETNFISWLEFCCSFATLFFPNLNDLK